MGTRHGLPFPETESPFRTEDTIPCAEPIPSQHPVAGMHRPLNVDFMVGQRLRSLDNKLQGKVPMEFGNLEFVNEINLENNNLSGRVPFSAKVGEKLGLKRN
ncbi:hypothetical protein F3Y22_tig00113337pilonHSYRG00206 [Hibiscus syriacus]|uniref:Uncharacterized protein n=1 Tax=Hibiscus syriacus TaxID=106335 RepID=A0A6A2Y303_HIBSY|nr:hypothetical protein F3Y22_tig00113337pilonHSYRG00206 [Hibiscus syriacus]